MIGYVALGCQPRGLLRRWAGVCGGALLAFGLVGVFGVSPALAQTCQPRVGAQGAEPFTVWYCQGDGKAQQATAEVARVLDGVWEEETRPEPDGLGPPIPPEANGGRISIYVTAPNVTVDLPNCPGMCNKMVNPGSEGVTFPTNPVGFNQAGGFTSSAAIIINENIGLNDATVIHEFFHALQDRHNFEAASSWLGEAAATWAEQGYRATNTSRVNYFRSFQANAGASLGSQANSHHYGAYVWLLWLAQRAESDRAVFGLWSEPLPQDSDQAPVIDRVLGSYLDMLGLSWARDFKDFAVEDLNRNLGAVTPRLFSRGPFGDPAVPLGVTPRFIRPPSTLTLGTRRTPVSLRLLSARYEYLRAVGGRVRAVVITANRMRPWGDLVILARTRFGWQRRDLQNGSVSFCRQRPRQNVDQLYLIADNHDNLQNRSGASYTVTGKPRCS